MLTNKVEKEKSEINSNTSFYFFSSSWLLLFLFSSWIENKNNKTKKTSQTFGCMQTSFGNILCGFKEKYKKKVIFFVLLKKKRPSIERERNEKQKATEENLNTYDDHNVIRLIRCRQANFVYIFFLSPFIQRKPKGKEYKNGKKN